MPAQLDRILNLFTVLEKEHLAMGERLALWEQHVVQLMEFCDKLTVLCERRLDLCERRLDLSEVREDLTETRHQLCEKRLKVLETTLITSAPTHRSGEHVH